MTAWRQPRPGKSSRGGKRWARDASDLSSQTHAASQATGILTIPEACSQEPSWQHDTAATAREGGRQNLNIPRLGLPTWSQVLAGTLRVALGLRGATLPRRCGSAGTVGGCRTASRRASWAPLCSEVTEAQCRPSGSQTAARARAGEHPWAERLSGAMHVYIAHLDRPPSLLYRPVVQVVST